MPETVELTRNLYRLDEVIAACIYSLSNGRAREACFWCAELILSDHANDAIYSMIYAWLHTLGPLRLEWYRRAWEVFRHDTVCETDILQFASALASTVASKPLQASEEGYTSTKDTTAPFLVLLKATERYDTVPLVKEWKKVAGLGSTRGSTGWKELEKKAGADARMRQWLFALQDMSALIGEGYAEQLAPIALAVGFLGGRLNKEQKEVSWRGITLRSVDEEAQGWLVAPDGVRRERRVFEIPYMCLYGMTARGLVAQGESTIDELRGGLEDTLLEGGGWWGERIETMYPLLGAGDDETRERFYDTEFPEDIPDEWSSLDQKKSHGGGARLGGNSGGGAGADGVIKARVVGRWYPPERAGMFSGGEKEALAMWRGVRGLI